MTHCLPHAKNGPQTGTTENLRGFQWNLPLIRCPERDLRWSKYFVVDFISSLTHLTQLLRFITPNWQHPHLWIIICHTTKMCTIDNYSSQPHHAANKGQYKITTCQNTEINWLWHVQHMHQSLREHWRRGNRKNLRARGLGCLWDCVS